MALLLLVDGMDKRNPKKLIRVGGNVMKRLKIKPKRKVERERATERDSAADGGKKRRKNVGIAAFHFPPSNRIIKSPTRPINIHHISSSPPHLT